MTTENPPATTTLTRFLIDDDDFSRMNDRVRHTAFLPPKNLKLSVFLIDGLTDLDIWPLCLRRPCHGRADLLAIAVDNNKLRLDVDNTPPRHANITGWPTEKSEQKHLAKILAAEASLKLLEHPLRGNS